jgi:hypothetical protein
VIPADLHHGEAAHGPPFTIWPLITQIGFALFDHTMASSLYWPHRSESPKMPEVDAGCFQHLQVFRACRGGSKEAPLTTCPPWPLFSQWTPGPWVLPPAGSLGSRPPFAPAEGGDLGLDSGFDAPEAQVSPS